MSFLETPRFPVDISYNSRGGPGYRTLVIVPRSGIEKRTRIWTYPRHEYDVAYGIRSLDDLESLIEFFHVAAGRAYGFRYKDWADYKSCRTDTSPTATDQVIGTADGSETEFQLKKIYTKSSTDRTRLIRKPVSGTVLIAVDGVAQGSGWSVNTATGIVTFDSAPGDSTNPDVTAGFEFDVPVRFDVDQLSVVLEDYEAASVQVPVIEDKSENQ